MKLYAQQGSMEGDRIASGIRNKLIDGVILSPRDISRDTMKSKINEYKSIDSMSELYFDPQLYAAFSPSGERHKLGYLLEDYSEYFKPYRRTQLTKESSVEELLRCSIGFQNRIVTLSAVIAPNIIIPRSLDSIETVISMNFIRLARRIATRLQIKKPLFVTLAINREALFKVQDIIEIVNDLTALDEPPDGFYILIATRSQEARSEIFNADVISIWMYLNYALSLNGFKVINGYSDLMAPFLSAAQGVGAATGWWSNLRNFSIDKFEPAVGGGRLPIQRYLSCSLLNRITFSELDQLRIMPEILNGLSTDNDYPVGGEPARNKEILQSWESLKKLISAVDAENIGTVLALKRCIGMVEKAIGLYERITVRYDLDQKSNADHLPAIQEGIELFKKNELAELDLG
jgi:hypothetical protein